MRNKGPTIQPPLSLAGIKSFTVGQRARLSHYEYVPVSQPSHLTPKSPLPSSITLGNNGHLFSGGPAALPKTAPKQLNYLVYLEAHSYRPKRRNEVQLSRLRGKQGIRVSYKFLPGMLPLPPIFKWHQRKRKEGRVHVFLG